MEAEIPDDWTKEPLRNLGTFHKGRGGPKRDDQPSGVPVVRYGELYTHHHDVIRQFHSFVSPERAEDYTRLKTGDLLFAGAGETAEEIGKSAVFLGPEPAHGSGDMIIFRPDGRVDPLFLGYASNGRVANAHKMSVGQGSSILHIYGRDLEDLELPFPPLPEQRKIATILSSVDDAIRAIRKVIEQTKRVKKGVLQTLMTRGIGHVRFKKTEIGEIPEEWEVRTLTDVADVVDCKHRTPVYSDEGVPIVRPGDVGHGILDLSGCARVSESDYADLSEGRTANVGDLVYSRNQTFGLAGLVADDTPFALGQDTCLIKPKGIRSGFLHAVLESRLVWRQIHRVMGGSTFKRINLGDIRRFQLPIPSEKEQVQVESAITNVRRMSTSNAATVSALSTLKRGLMQDLLTGRVRVQPD